ncbi:PadR family transcriptional regulator [Methanobrevibacter filiformis]|uniref:Lineage-specific thermal regulator protein n=1 Tax=Methanobrevibacter filiformis TaxID=55758 RepID=A0A166DXC9_9EURY|nr:helix-turn-helix transcriptional regulator [Methanobrevibacter filiformis]KZX16052.1 lineage-specific thermal regulator protein [Methanobrevibacter filiformis]
MKNDKKVSDDESLDNEPLCDFDEKMLKHSAEGMMKRRMMIMIVLWIINKERTYGYELIKELNKGIPNDDNSKIKAVKKHFGSNRIYPMLKILEHKELIVGTWEMDKNRKIKYYETTDRGKCVLKKLKSHLANNTPPIFKEFLEENFFGN